jgi:hypothetical protein
MILILKKIDKPIFHFCIFFFIYFLTSYSIWKRYQFNPTSQIHFGKEFALQNKSKMPDSAIVELGEKNDLGAGYDGQIFYFFSRTLSDFSLDWPKGFDESYRAPRIGYPFLISLFGLFGKQGSIFGMYFVNIFLFFLSFVFLRRILDEDKKYLALFYLLSPFSLGSYAVLVSDTVMVSLVIIAYYYYLEEKNVFFILISSLAILCKEPALFFFFPLGLKVLLERRISKVLLIASILIIPIAWHVYLRFVFPNWRAARLTDFIEPLEGILTYLETMISTVTDDFQFFSFSNLARILSRFPLLILLCLGLYSILTGDKKRGNEFRLMLVLCFFMISTASYYHFWSVYENISRMFTLSIPVFILLKNENETVKVNNYFSMSLVILFLFLIKIVLIQKTQNFTIWGL